MAPLLAALGRLEPEGCFVEIGAGKGNRTEGLSRLLAGFRWRGVVVDPIPGALARCGADLGDSPRIALERAAIAGMDEQRPFFFVEAPAEQGNRTDATSVNGALQREVLFFPRTYFPGIDERVVEIQTPCLTFESLCRRHGVERLDVLRIDTAGDEAEILEQVDLQRYRPAVIAYSHALLGAGVREGSTQRLNVAGYETLELTDETWSFNEAALSERSAGPVARIWRGIVRAKRREQHLAQLRSLGSKARRRLALRDVNGADPVAAFPLSEAERRYLANGYDDRVPVDPGATAHLSQDNPRLLDLRRSYAALKLPATDHVIWSSNEVRRDVDLRHFRGDNLYLWHYPEHPRAMELKFFLYMKYLLGRGGEALLASLSEDGGFGAWTVDVRGHGRISRDLLDSVNEILFLDRELGILDGGPRRILDVGAGYGRLAHRLTEAVPGLDDYCCVDAVPESTFLCEYYLGFRGVSPPARAVPLGDVPALEPGSFDLAINVHSFSECTLAAIQWWLGQLKRLRVPKLFVVPNEADGILSTERDGSYRSALPALEAVGYVQVAKERAIADPAVRDLAGLNDNFYLFSLAGAEDSASGM